MKWGKELLKRGIPVLLFGLVVFLAAGRWDYGPGWALLGVVVVMNLVTVGARGVDQELMKERALPGKGRKGWDSRIIGLAFPGYLLALLVGSLDSGRFHWTGDAGWVPTVAGVVLNLVGLGLFETAKRQNRFFSTVVRIQRDRGQQVVDRGLYSVVRHPGYLGTAVSTVGLPLIFASVWAAIPALVYLGLFVLRTALEDDLLTRELEGYADYRSRVRYRLVPLVW